MPITTADIPDFNARIRFYCPDCDLPYGTVCHCCLICSECLQVKNKDTLEKYMTERVKKLRENMSKGENE